LGIDAKFRRAFREFEEGHIAIREELNRFGSADVLSHDYLDEEVVIFNEWWLPRVIALAELTSGLDAHQYEEYRRFVWASRYFEIVQEAPFYWRIIHKPRGYAGDAQMLAFIYRNTYEGTTPFGTLLHKHITLTETCQSVRNRKDYLFEQILKTEGGNILSLAAGSAWEIRDVLESAPEGRFRFLALDHDIETLKLFRISGNLHFRYALANAFHIIRGNYLTACPRPLWEASCSPRSDFKGIRRFWAPLKYELKRIKEDNYDLVYAAGLYDYIKTFPDDHSKGAIALTKNLFSFVKTGGTLIIGNLTFCIPPKDRFMMDYVYDWRLIYRNKEEMLALARSIPAKQIRNIQIDEEPLGINYFLKIEKA